MDHIKQHKEGEKGIALVIILLLVGATTAMGLLMYLSVNSDLQINGYYRNFRSSFYSADSGLNIARAQLVNQVRSAIPATFAVPPIGNPATIAANVQTALAAQYASYATLNAGQAARSWSSSFKVTNVSLTLAPGSPTITARDGSNNPTGYNYVFNYALTTMGTAQGADSATVSEKGSITFNIIGAATQTVVSMAAFGAFIDQYPPCLGPLVPGIMTGPMFTNGSWQFMTGGAYIFTDPVGQANSNADYWFGNNCLQSPTSSYTYGRQAITPGFQAGFNLGQPPVPLPPNNFAQKRAVLDGFGTNLAAPTNAELNAVLKNVSGTAYPAAGTTSGVYLPYTSNGGVNVLSGGGIFVEGNAQVTLSPSGASAQVYSIVQAGTTTTITTDALATPAASWNCPAGTTGTTVVHSGATTTNVCGVPMDHITNHAATMVYVDGAITGLSGPGQGQGAIQDGTQITITANGDITATGDVLYKTEPVTTTQNQIIPGSNPPCCSGTQLDTIIPGNDSGQVLGIFTATGNFNLNTNQSGGNIQVDGSIATISANGTGGFLNTGPAINTFNNVGGQIQNSIYAADINTENVYFDRRFTNNPGFAPPWFPMTTVTQGGALSTNITSSVQRIQWINSTTM